MTSIYYIEWVIRCTERITTTDTNLGTCTRSTTSSLYINTGNLTNQHV